jgi:hypothetical protein
MHFVKAGDPDPDPQHPRGAPGHYGQPGQPGPPPINLQLQSPDDFWARVRADMSDKLAAQLSGYYQSNSEEMKLQAGFAANAAFEQLLVQVFDPSNRQPPLLPTPPEC